VIIPAYNEEGGLAAVLHDLAALDEERIEFLVVDDGSTDLTAAVGHAAGARVVRHDRNRGKGAAVRTGLVHARGDRIAVIDADGTYPAREIPALLERLDRHDLVLGARTIGRDNIPLFNRLGNAAFSTAIRVASGARAADPLTGLYAARRSALLALELEAEGFGIETEIIMKATAGRLRTVDHPVSYGARVGTTKLRPMRDGLVIGRTLVRLALARGFRRRGRSRGDA
jgi:dolichol-phosphate mannosyltransferase